MSFYKKKFYIILNCLEYETEANWELLLKNKFYLSD